MEKEKKNFDGISNQFIPTTNLKNFFYKLHPKKTKYNFSTFMPQIEFLVSFLFCHTQKKEIFLIKHITKVSLIFHPHTLT